MRSAVLMRVDWGTGRVQPQEETSADELFAKRALEPDSTVQRLIQPNRIGWTFEVHHQNDQMIKKKILLQFLSFLQHHCRTAVLWWTNASFVQPVVAIYLYLASTCDGSMRARFDFAPFHFPLYFWVKIAFKKLIACHLYSKWVIRNTDFT